MSTLEALEHWRLRVDDEGIAWLDADRAGEEANSLNEAMLNELDMALDHLNSHLPKGLVIGSAKSSGFIAGADIREFDSHTSAKIVSSLISVAHQLFQKLEDFPAPTVCAIDGFCLGGGLELALCCDYLIATDSDKTRIGLPEVKLGIFPGFGGSVRLPRRIGAHQAMPLMLTGRMLKPAAARGLGVIDELVGRHGNLHWSARKAVLKKRRSRKPGALVKLSNSALARPLLARAMRKQTAAKARKEHYPAPFTLIDTWAAHGGMQDRKAHFTAEADAVGELMVGDTSRGLRRVFNLMEGMKKAGKASDFKARRVHVIGAGVMGADIAAYCAMRGLEVTLQDREQKFIDSAIARVDKVFKKRIKKPGELIAVRSRLQGDLEGKGVARADVVIEAIIEDAQIKRDLFATLEPQLKSDAVLATNTSSLPLEEISTGLQNPARLIGLHFFNPVAMMPLVEIIHGEGTDQEVVNKGLAFGNQINKMPLAVKSSPGFLVNRVLAPYMTKALELHVEQGAKLEDIDEAALAFGMPMGPLELSDVVGIDVCLKVSENLGASEQMLKLMQDSIAAGNLGKKSGQGLYRWEKGKAVKPVSTASKAELDKLCQPMIDAFVQECLAVQSEGLVEDDDALDAGIIFGTGFAPFRGGPLHYHQQQS
ncbi:MAG: 3-hydroxyacyl-CoA dehydrogenase NAD-binding domain-containing protein [Granulosicoccaceae bacterium]